MKEKQTATNASLPEKEASAPASSQPGAGKLSRNVTALQDQKVGESSNRKFTLSPVWFRKVEEGDLKLVLWLLLIICMVCLGSLPVIPRLLPITFAPVPSSVPAAPIVSSPALIGNGQCIASLQEIKDMPDLQGNGPTLHLPAVWYQAGRNAIDFANAQVCAASFIVAYYTFDTQKAETLEACVPMLSVGAKQRFYRQGANKLARLHMDPLWPNSQQQQHLQQEARASVPYILAARYQNGILLAWIVVPYQLAIRSANQVYSKSYLATMLVILQSSTNPDQKSSWQVSDWRANITYFAPPSVL